MKERYFRELQSIKGMHFDVAFLPVDPRLKERALKGARAFLQYASMRSSGTDAFLEG
ncbi:MAG: hypothetical protein ACLTDX_17645 [[Clostridium] innocuum]